MLVECEYGFNVVILNIFFNDRSDCGFTPFRLHSINHIFIVETFIFVNSKIFSRLPEFFRSDCVTVGKTEKVNEILMSEGCQGGSEEHGLVIRMCKNEENVMLFDDFSFLFHDVYDQ